MKDAIGALKLSLKYRLSELELRTGLQPLLSPQHEPRYVFEPSWV